MKFGKTGRHPIEDRALNVVEQINQTFSYLVALNAAKGLLEAHPDAGATHPQSNRKLDKDLKRLAGDPSRHRYALSYSPEYTPGRHPRLEKVEGVQVHGVDI